jgi:polyferredoxin
MACPCKKKVEQIVEYDRKLGENYNTSITQSNFTVTEVEEKEPFSFYDFTLKIFNPILGILRGLFMVLTVTLLFIAIIIVMVPYMFFIFFMKFIFNKDMGGVHNPFTFLNKWLKKSKKNVLQNDEKIVKNLKKRPLYQRPKNVTPNYG